MEEEAKKLVQAAAKNEYISMHDLNNTPCKKARDFTVTLYGDSTVLSKGKVVKEAVGKCLTGEITPANLHEYLESNFALIPYKSETQRKTQLEESFRRILRYVSYAVKEIWPYLLSHEAKLVKLDPSIRPVRVDPDYVALKNNTLYIIKYRERKPLSGAEFSTDLGIYSMILYGREFLKDLPAGTVVNEIHAQYHFLRKLTDTSVTSKDGSHFDKDFLVTNDKGLIVGNNIMGYKEKTEKMSQKATDFDFSDSVKNFVDGLDSKECRKSDCENCALKILCKYNDAPLVVTTEKKKTNIKDISLSADQDRAVSYEKGILRILAGAGAGKTLVVALRVVVLLNKGYRPSDILMITFSNAGAEEMRERIGVYLKDFGINVNPEDITITTFNSFGYEIVKKEYARFGYTAEPMVIDDIDRSRIIAEILNKKIVPGLNYRDFLSSGKNYEGALSVTRKCFDIIKRDNLVKGDEEALIKALGHSAKFLVAMPTEGGYYPQETEVASVMFDLYDEYNSKLVGENLIEFADQEVLLERLLEEDPFYLEQFGYKHIIVDEFQDTSMQQFRLIKKLRNTKGFMSLMIVGDDAQGARRS